MKKLLTILFILINYISFGQLITNKGVIVPIVPVANGGTGTATPSLVAGTNITSITGTWPNQTVNAATQSAAASVTEQKQYYHGEFYFNKGFNTSTGAFTDDATKSISDYLPIEGSTSLTITTTDSTNITIYGWTYDSTLTAISEFRSNSLIGTLLKTYTFSTPSNARYIALYTKAASDSFNVRLRVYSTNSITYNVPVTPEQFTGTSDVDRINQAVKFARWTTSGVELKGTYFLDSAIILSSGSTLILHNAKLKMKYGMHDNIIRNEAVAQPASKIFNRGNRNIKIIGIGNAELHGSTEAWGGDAQTGLGAQKWRMAVIKLANVEEFEVSGLKSIAPHQYGFVFEQSRIGTVNNNTFEQGLEHLNQAGVQIHRSSNRINVFDIRGGSTDDLVEIGNLKYNDSMQILGYTIYEPYKTNLDIYGISVSNIQRVYKGTLGTFSGGATAYRNAVRLITADSLKIHDVSISKVYGPQQIFLQDPGSTYIISTAPGVNDMYNIQVSDVSCPVYIFRAVKQCSFINVPDKDETGVYSTVIPPAGSSKIYRKYTNGQPAFIDTVRGATEEISLLSGSFGLRMAATYGKFTMRGTEAASSASNMVEVYDNTPLVRHEIRGDGSMKMTFNGAGTYAFGNVSGQPGWIAFGSTLTGRTQMKMLSATGGLSWGTSSTTSDPGSQIQLTTGGFFGVGPTAPTSRLQTDGSLATGYAGSAIDLTLNATHQVMVLNVTAKTATLPTAVGITGRIYTVKLMVAGTGTVATTSSQTIDGVTTYSLTEQYKFVTVQSDGANWNIIARGNAVGQNTGTATNDNATAGNIGEEVNSVVSTYTNYTTSATYQNITSITLAAGDWNISAIGTFSSNSSTITTSANAIFVISTTTASESGSTEGRNILYIPQAALLGSSRQSSSMPSYRVSISTPTTYYLNTQATFTIGNPQYVGGISARRMR